MTINPLKNLKQAKDLMQFATMVKTKGIVEAIKTANFNFSVDFSIKLIPNIKTPQKHLYGLLFRDQNENNSITDQLDPEDIEALLSQFHERIKDKLPLKLTYAKVKYQQKTWTCIYIDIIEEKKDADSV